jgi:tRNA A37 methylthiotransferase MiaB
VVVVNTCGFIDSAVQESLEAIGEVLAEAKRLKEAGVKEILVISQDTSAYGVDEVHIDEADEYDLWASLVK